MLITRLELRDFRNYEHFVLEPSPTLTVLVGPNAAGKTNAVEAVQLVTSTQSFRRPKLDQVVRWGAERALVRLRAEEPGRLLETEMEVDASGRRTYRVNGQTRRRLADVAGIVPSVVFTPDDLEMVKGPAEGRRSTIDDMGEQLSATYGSLRRDYGRVVRHRNALLREQAASSHLEPWDEQLAALGAQLAVHRMRLLERVMPAAAQHYAAMAGGEELTYEYADRCGLGTCDTTSVPDVRRAILEEAARRSGEERRRATTLAGPHRDDIVFRIAGREARSFASQGQQRTVALAWKLAEVEVVRDVLHRDPVLLLDDVMSELDAERRAALSDLVSTQIQTFVTTTNTGYFTEEMLERAVLVPIERSER